MTPGIQIVCSGLLTFGIPMLMAWRELHVLRRPGTGPGWGGGPHDPPPPPPRPQDWHSERKPLPACLIPCLPLEPERHAPHRVRELA